MTNPPWKVLDNANYSIGDSKFGMSSVRWYNGLPVKDNLHDKIQESHEITRTSIRILKLDQRHKTKAPK